MSLNILVNHVQCVSLYWAECQRPPFRASWSDQAETLGSNRSYLGILCVKISESYPIPKKSYSLDNLPHDTEYFGKFEWLTFIFVEEIWMVRSFWTAFLFYRSFYEEGTKWRANLILKISQGAHNQEPLKSQTILLHKKIKICHPNFSKYSVPRGKLSRL